MTYGVPVWIKVLEKECNRKIYNRLQRIINIKIAKAYRTTSNEALCTLTGLTPIVIKAEEEAKIFNIMKGSIQNEIDKDEKPKDWLHPAEFVRIIVMVCLYCNVWGCVCVGFVLYGCVRLM